MRALQFERPAPDTGATRVVAVETPEPGPGEVAIDVRAAGINFIDVMARRGDPGYATSWPYVPGLEVAGTVRALGAGVAGPEVGTPVAAFTGSGGLAEVAVVKAELVAEVPESDVRAGGCCSGTLTTAALLLSRLQPASPCSCTQRRRRTGTGRLAAQGSGLLGTVGGASRVQGAEKAGYDAALVRGEGLAGAVRERTGGRGVDLILDPQGTEWIETDLELVSPGGRIVLFGNASGTPLAPLAVGPLFGGNASVGGFSIRGYAAKAPELVAAALVDVLRNLSEGRLESPPNVVEGLENAAEAQQALADGRGGGKYVVRV